jgi:hypothetical protein
MHPLKVIGVVLLGVVVAGSLMAIGFVAFLKVAGDPGPPIGYAVVANRPVVMVQVCGGAKFRELTVSKVKFLPGSGGTSGEAGTPIWKVTSSGLPTREFRIGDAPRGWMEEVALASPAPPKSVYVKLKYTDGFASEGILDTRPAPPLGKVAYGGDVVSSRDFFGRLRSKQCASMN